MTSINIYATLWSLKEGYSTVRPVEIVKAIGKEIALNPDIEAEEEEESIKPSPYEGGKEDGIFGLDST